VVLALVVSLLSKGSSKFFSSENNNNNKQEKSDECLRTEDNETNYMNEGDINIYDTAHEIPSDIKMTIDTIY
jgi:hypothetical protein